jgi:hypothetical protein
MNDTFCYRKIVELEINKIAFFLLLLKQIIGKLNAYQFITFRVNYRISSLSQTFREEYQSRRIIY